MELTPSPPHSKCLDWLFSENAPRNPCFVVDADRLRHNASILNNVQNATGAKILLALKAFSTWPVFPLLSRRDAGPLWGTCASSVDEARLGKEKFGGEVHAFAAAWTGEEIGELLHLADHIVFNSLNQWHKHKKKCLLANETFRSDNPVSFGIRLNPAILSDTPQIYNPCGETSRLGVRAQAARDPSRYAEFDGLHFHALCEQGAETLQLALHNLEENFASLLPGRKWLNFGGGHHITKAGYNLELLKKLLITWRKRHHATIYLEPGEAVALNAGWLTATVLDIVETDMPTAILDISAACHMPDVMEMPYTPPVWQKTWKAIQPAREWNSGEAQNRYRLAGKSCLAGDIIGQYNFKKKLTTGDRLVFGDMAIYSMVKTTTFNGLRLPSIGVYDGTEEKFTLLREFDYQDFLTRLG